MPGEQLVALRDIVIPKTRLRVANHIDALAASIAQNGLLHPITLRRDGSRLILVAGLRRIAAIQMLKRDVIPAYVLDVDATRGLMIEIDENLQRAELTELQRAQHLAERKRVWEALHPQTRHGGTPGKTGPGRGGKSRRTKDADSASLVHVPDEPPARSFVEDTAQVTQRSRRTVEVSAQIGAKLSRTAQALLAARAGGLRPPPDRQPYTRPARRARGGTPEIFNPTFVGLTCSPRARGDYEFRGIQDH